MVSFTAVTNEQHYTKNQAPHSKVLASSVASVIDSAVTKIGDYKVDFLGEY
jgi:hypothetical protein